MLFAASATSSAWHVSHFTFTIFAGWGKSLMDVWQSVHPRTAWTLAACFSGGMEMLLPFSDFMSGCPWQARQASSCFRGWGGFSWSRAERDRGINASSARDRQKILPCVRILQRRGYFERVATVICIRSSSPTGRKMAARRYFSPRSVRTLGFDSSTASRLWQAEQSFVIIWPSALVWL